MMARVSTGETDSDTASYHYQPLAHPVTDVVRALDEFADATAQHLPTQDDVLSVVRDMVKAWDFADMHHECTFDGIPPVQYPISRNDGGYCVYICRTCGSPWRCWYR